MSSAPIRPTTLAGIKRLAKRIKVERSIPLFEAQDAAAKAGGFESFRHARRSMKAHIGPAVSAAVAPCDPLYITFNWQDPKSGTAGRETLAIYLPVVWSDLITKAQMKHFRAFASLEVEGPDHLAGALVLRTQSAARQAACHAARGFAFMNATKLRPSSGYRRVLPKGDWNNKIPGADHDSVWYDAAFKNYVFVDEPYEPSAVRHSAEREAWAVKHGYHLLKVQHWHGMYYPDGGSRMYLIADKSTTSSLLPYATALDVLPRIDESSWSVPRTPDIDGPHWETVSAPRLPRFISPGTLAATTEKKKPPKAPVSRAPSTPRRTVGYVQTFVGKQRRPDARMPIETHLRVAGLLKRVQAATYARPGVHNRVNRVRSDLDEWVMREYTPEELPGEIFHEMYFGSGPTPSTARALSAYDLQQHASALDQVKEILIQNYPDCLPLRQLLKKVDSALRSLQRWSPAS